MMKLTTTALILVLLLFIRGPGSAGARQISPLEGLETLRRSFAGTTDFTAEIVQEKQLSLMKKKLVSTGIVRFRKPSLFFMELNPPHASRLVLHDNQLSLHLPKEKTTSKIVLPPEQSLQQWFSYLSRPVTALPEGVDVTAEQQGDFMIVTIIPRQKGQIREMIVTLQAENMIRRLVIAEQGGDRTTITFSGVRRNVGLKEKDFPLE
jgi:outer membrane lipoprotein carrier protein